MKRLVLGAVAILFLAAATANSQPGLGMMSDELNLTDQQMEQLETLKLQHQREMVQKQADLKMAGLDLKEIMMKDNIDEKAALAKQDKLSSIKADIAKAKLRHKIAARKLLDSDQLLKWRKLQKEMKGRRDGCGPDRPGMGPMGHGPMGPGMMGHGMMESGSGMRGGGQED